MPARGSSISLSFGAIVAPMKQTLVSGCQQGHNASESLPLPSPRDLRCWAYATGALVVGAPTWIAGHRAAPHQAPPTVTTRSKRGRGACERVRADGGGCNGRRRREAWAWRFSTVAVFPPRAAQALLLPARAPRHRCKTAQRAWQSGQHLPPPQLAVSPSRQDGLKQRTAFAPGPLQVDGASSHCSTAKPVALYSTTLWRSAATTWSGAQQ